MFGNPDQVGGAITTTTVAAVFVSFAAFALSALSLVVRYRRASGVERHQLKWVALAAVVGASFLVGQQLSFVGQLLGLDRSLGEAFLNLLDAAITTALYVAVGIAILRYRLYDIDVIINRATAPSSTGPSPRR